MCCACAEASHGTARTAEEKLAVEGQLQHALQQTAALESELEAAKAAVTELEVSLAVQTMTKNVADADLHSQIAALNEKLEDGAQALAKAEANLQTLTDDTQQQGVKRCYTQPVWRCCLAGVRDCTTVSAEDAGRSWRLESALCLIRLHRSGRPTRLRWRTSGGAWQLTTRRRWRTLKPRQQIMSR